MSDRSVWRLEDEVDRLRDEVARLRFTDAEREAVRWAVSAASNVEHPAEDALRGLLERCAIGHQ